MALKINLVFCCLAEAFLESDLETKGCKIYRHLTDITEGEKAHQRLKQDEDTDICDEDDDQPPKKKLKVSVVSFFIWIS